MGGLYECAVNALPVVPLPFALSADQPVNARAAEAAGFAVRPELLKPIGRRPWRSNPTGHKQAQLTSVAIREAVNRAITDPALKDGAHRARRSILACAHGRGGVDAVEAA